MNRGDTPPAWSRFFSATVRPDRCAGWHQRVGSRPIHPHYTPYTFSGDQASSLVRTSPMTEAFLLIRVSSSTRPWSLHAVAESARRRATAAGCSSAASTQAAPAFQSVYAFPPARVLPRRAAPRLPRWSLQVPHRCEASPVACQGWPFVSAPACLLALPVLLCCAFATWPW
jgi:hypothetical protein